MDVINAAKKISEAGNKLDKLTRKIAGQCPESSTKEDLLAYLERIALYCHQIQITSKVKADVQNISGELIVSGVSIENDFHKLDEDIFMSFSWDVSVGQCDIIDPGGQKLDERCRVDCEVFVRCIDEVHPARRRCGKWTS